MESTDRGHLVQLAGTEQDSCDACSVRSAAYGHHDPDMVAKLGQAEMLDKAQGTVVSWSNCAGTSPPSGFGQ